MTSTIKCLRCDTLVPLEIRSEHGVDEDEMTVDVAGGQGMLTAVCRNCMTDDECVQLLTRSTVALLDAAEEGLAGLEQVIFRAQPHLREDPRFKEQQAYFEQQIEMAKATLKALLDAAPTDE